MHVADFQDLTSLQHVSMLCLQSVKLTKIRKPLVFIPYIIRCPQLRYNTSAASTLFYLRFSLTESEEKEAESEFTVHLP